MSKFSTSLTFPFGESQGEGILSLENYQTVFVGLGSLALALTDTIPTGTRHLFTTAGTVVDIGLKVDKPIDAQFITVENASTATINPDAEYEIALAFDEDGNELEQNRWTGLKEISRVGTTVTFSKKFYGMILVKKHTIPVDILKYTPGRTGAVDEISGTTAFTDTYGYVAVYKEGRMTTCEVNPPTISDGDDSIEVYRVESKILINKEGEWEMPNGWPDNPTYPTGATPPKPRVGVVSTRVHELGLVTPTGYFYSRTFNIVNAKPYFGDNTYKPKTEVVQGKGFSNLPEDMKIEAQEAMKRRGKEQYL